MHSTRQGRNLFGQLTVFQNRGLGGITIGTKEAHARILEVPSTAAASPAP